MSFADKICTKLKTSALLFAATTFSRTLFPKLASHKFPETLQSNKNKFVPKVTFSGRSMNECCIRSLWDYFGLSKMVSGSPLTLFSLLLTLSPRSLFFSETNVSKRCPITQRSPQFYVAVEYSSTTEKNVPR